MKIRDRIRELRRVKASQLRPHPRNWRLHPQRQQDALRGILAEIGYADALLARELPDKSLQLIDGHLRAELTPEMEVPVLILDLDETEADKLLALLDPLASLAEADEILYAELAQQVQTQNAALHGVLEEWSAQAHEGTFDDREANRDLEVPEAFQVVVECKDEDEQRELFERLTAEGYSCRLLTL